MSNSLHAFRAYEDAARNRSLREREADIFRRANVHLRRARVDGPVAEARALADCERLWLMVCDLVRDPANALPETLRAAIASVGSAVQRELRQSSPDLDFLIAVNDDMAAGLSGRG